MPTSISTDPSFGNGPLAISAVASCAAPAAVEPRYAVNAFSPHGHAVGSQIGANADTDAYVSPPSLSAIVSAPWPPIEWPEMERTVGDTLKCDSTSAGSSCVTYEYML